MRAIAFEAGWIWWIGVPLVAIGLFYDQGYFRQHLDQNGYQREEYQDTKVENTPLEPARLVPL